jgi:hypothetical protein
VLQYHKPLTVPDRLAEAEDAMPQKTKKTRRERVAERQGSV